MAILRNNPNINKQFDNLKINNYGAIVCSLVKRFGESSIEHVQNVTNNSLKKFKKQWSRETIPHNPHEIIWNDIVKNSNKLFCKKFAYHKKKSGNERFDIKNFQLKYPSDDEAITNQVQLIFCIIDSKIEDSYKKYLLLNIICGFTYSEIARIYNKNERIIEEKVFKEKLKITDHEIYFKVQKRNFSAKKIEDLTKEIKHIFNKGLNDKNGLKQLISNSSIKIAKVVANFPKTKTPEIDALLSYMLLKASRLDAMFDLHGNQLNLKEQNRELWNKQMIKEGIEYLHKSASGKNITIAHLEAGISAVHSLSPNYESTNWNNIISIYNNYLAFNYSPSVELDRAIAVSKLNGPKQGIDAIRNIKDLDKLNSSDLLYSTLGNFHLQLHKYEDALNNFEQAIKLAEQKSEKSFYNKKIKICQQRIDMSKRYHRSLSF